MADLKFIRKMDDLIFSYNNKLRELNHKFTVNKYIFENSILKELHQLVQTAENNEKDDKLKFEENSSRLLYSDNIKYLYKVNDNLDKFVSLFSSVVADTRMYLNDERYSDLLSNEKNELFDLAFKMRAIKEKYMSNSVYEDEINQCDKIIHKLKLIKNVLLMKIKEFQNSEEAVFNCTTTTPTIQPDINKSVYVAIGKPETKSVQEPVLNKSTDNGNVDESSPNSSKEIVSSSGQRETMETTNLNFVTHVNKSPTSTIVSASKEEEYLAMDVVDQSDVNNKVKEHIIKTSSNTSVAVKEETPYEYYIKLKQELEETQKFYQPILNERYEQLRFHIKKIVILPINTLLTSKPYQLKVKCNDIIKALDFAVQRLVQVQHPEMINYTLPYVLDALAEKFMDHAEQTISRKPKTAFLLAALLVVIWLKYAKFGALFLARLMTKCPYVIPHYFPKLEGQSDEDYYKTIGYLYNEGKRETLEKFLQRMTGLIQLYAAVTITPVPVNITHPHGINYSWKWTANTLNLEPVPHITTTIIYHFLEITNAHMNARFGRQFQKIIILLVEEILPLIDKVTPSDYKAPVTRLQMFLEHITVKGCRKPEGILPDNFWS